MANYNRPNAAGNKSRTDSANTEGLNGRDALRLVYHAKPKPAFFEARGRFERAVSMADWLPRAARNIVLALIPFTYTDEFSTTGLLIAKVSKPKLARATGHKSERSVDYALFEALRREVIAVHKQGGARKGERYNNSEYELRWDWMEAAENRLGDRLHDWSDKMLPLPERTKHRKKPDSDRIEITPPHREPGERIGSRRRTMMDVALDNVAKERGR
jgi:hypothetical protein